MYKVTDFKKVMTDNFNFSFKLGSTTTLEAETTITCLQLREQDT
jgi:hypothetical protein